MNDRLKEESYLRELEDLYYQNVEAGTELNTKNICDFLFNMMYSKRCIPVIQDDDKIVETAVKLKNILDMKKFEYLKHWYPLPDCLPDEIVNEILEYVFDPYTDPW